MKEKLLQLINICLENTTFYEYLDSSHYGDRKIKERIEVGGGGYTMRKINLSIDPKYCRSQYDSDQENIFREEKNTQYGIKLDSNILKFIASSMDITFTDLPPIRIALNSTVKELEKNTIEFDGTKTDWVKKHWYSEDYCNKTKKTGKKVKVDYDITERTPFYKITSGSITENITVQEFTELAKKFNDKVIEIRELQKERLRLADEAKITERIEKYNKKFDI